jgi:uncharacterized protein (DUF433 family)
MPTRTTDIGTLITRTAEIRGGRPRIAGTGVTVQRIVGWTKLGLTPEEIVAEIGHVTLAQVHAALAYYTCQSASDRVRDRCGPGRSGEARGAAPVARRCLTMRVRKLKVGKFQVNFSTFNSQLLTFDL